MKTKYVIKSKNEFEHWLKVGNIFARSICNPHTILKQYNALIPDLRRQIKNKFLICDEIRRTKIPNTEDEAWFMGVMVDAHIIGTEYNIDPLTVILCINPICKANEKIIVR